MAFRQDISFEGMMIHHRQFIINRETTRDQLIFLRTEMIKHTTDLSSYQELIDLINEKLGKK
jgi:hypothetical protein